MTKEHYISEGYYGKWNGCLVRVPGFAQKLFSYSDYDSVRECRADAREYRDALIAERGGWETIPKRGGGHSGGTQIYTKPTRKNKLQLLGLHVEKRWRKEGRRKRLVWNVIAQLQLPGGARREKQISVRVYGMREAIRLALAARAEFEMERDRLLATGGQDDRRKRSD